jgi:hypothetical protein
MRPRRRRERKRAARSSPLTPSFFQSDFRDERRKNGASFHLSFRLSLPFFLSLFFFVSSSRVSF